MRKTFTISEEGYQKLLDAGKPVRYMIFGGHEPTSPQENANYAWKRLGDEMGFKWDTVIPDGTNSHIFTAEEK